MVHRWPHIDGPGSPTWVGPAPRSRGGWIPLPVAGVAYRGSVGEEPATQASLLRAPAAPLRAAPIGWAILLGPVSPRTWRAIANLVISLVTGSLFFTVLVFALLLSGALSWIVGIGMLVLTFTLRLAARMAGLDRRRIRRMTGVRIEPAPPPGLGSELSFRQRQKAWSQSPVVRRLVAYQIIRPPVSALSLLALAWVWVLMVSGFNGSGPVGSTNGFTGLLLGLVCLFVWPLAARLGSSLDVSLARWLLGPSRSGQLSAEVQRLGEARTLAVESAESERRRIERDLHDGLQPKLVSLALELGLAKARFERDPESVRSLINQAHEEAKTAIEDLRGLVRGIHPSVLDERGLDAAFSALVASCAVPVRVEVSLSKRLDQAIEAVAYFVVAEAITNVTKHSGASRARVTITEASGLLRVLVEDDGGGGASAEPGGGLAGLAARVAAIDGTFTLKSPKGGPTRIEATIPVPHPG
jgi:signal transduction histidine kinase